MMNFNYLARDRSGRVTRGALQADSPLGLKSLLQSMGLQMVSLEALPEASATLLGDLDPRRWMPVRSRDVEFSLRQLAIMLRSGLNLRFSDPSLTIPQILSSTLVTLYVLYESKDGHGVLSMIYLVSFTFGVFRLSTRQLLALTAFTAVSYALLIGWQWHADPDPYLLKRKVLTWIALISVLAFFSVIGGYVSKLRKDVADSRKRLEAAMLQVQNMAARDELTGVFNRRTLADVLNVHKNRADRYGTIFSVLMLDIDHFKRVNDTYGHQNGDRVLKAFAAAISSGLRSTDILGRYGGEEFVVIMPDTTQALAQQAADRIRALIADAPFTIGRGESLRVTMSGGVATTNPPDETIDTQLKRADDALYRAKHNGRNCIETERAGVE